MPMKAGFPPIVTDDRGLYDQLKAYLKEEQPEDLKSLNFMTTAFCLYISFTAWKLYWIVLLENVSGLNPAAIWLLSLQRL